MSIDDNTRFPPLAGSIPYANDLDPLLSSKSMKGSSKLPRLANVHEAHLSSPKDSATPVKIFRRQRRVSYPGESPLEQPLSPPTDFLSTCESSLEDSTQILELFDTTTEASKRSDVESDIVYEDPKTDDSEPIRRRRSYALNEEDLTRLMQAHSIDVPPRETKSAPPSEAPELTAEDRAIQKRVLQKFFKDSMTLHAHITALNILALCQATDRNKAGMEIRRALNLPTRVPSKSETKQTLLVDLDGLVARTNAINDLYSVVKL